MSRTKIALAATAVAGMAVGVSAPADAVGGVEVKAGLVFKVGSRLSDNGLGADTPSVPATIRWSVATPPASQHAFLYQSEGWETDFDLAPADRQVTTDLRLDSPSAFSSADITADSSEGYRAFRTRLAQSDALQRSAGWKAVSCDCRSEGSTLRSSTRGATITLPFAGSSLAVIGGRAPRPGAFKVLVNGRVVAKVSEGPGTSDMSVVVQRAFAHARPRTVVLKVISGTVDVDAVLRSRSA